MQVDYRINSVYSGWMKEAKEQSGNSASSRVDEVWEDRL